MVDVVCVWELLVLIVRESIPIMVQVYFRRKVCLLRPQNSVPWFLFSFVDFILFVALVQKLLVSHFVICILLHYHSCLRLEVWSVIEVVLKGFVVSKLTTHQGAGNKHCDEGVSPEESKSCSSRMNVGMVMHPSLIRNDCNSSLVHRCSSSNQDCKWPGQSCTNEEASPVLLPVLRLQLGHVFPWYSLGTSHPLLKPQSNPWVTANIVFKPLSKLKWLNSLTIACTQALFVYLVEQELPSRRSHLPLWFSAV